MAADLLTDRLTQIIHHHEMVLGAQIISRGGAEGVEARVGGVVNFECYRM